MGEKMENYQIDYQDKAVYPMGVTVLGDGIHVSICAKGIDCFLVLFQKDTKIPFLKIQFPEVLRMGDVFRMTIKGQGFEFLFYCFEIDGKLFTDPFGKNFIDCTRWGEPENHRIFQARIGEEAFDWGNDRQLKRSYEQSIIYRVHVRGFTRHNSSAVKNKGTFQGLIDKIPYLQELGITTLELMPINEFQEVVYPERVEGNPYGVDKPAGKINYWGYSDGFYFLPKASYSSGCHENSAIEFKTLVKKLHQSDIEIVIELYFTGKESPLFVLEVVRFWVREYHVDGIHLIGNLSFELVAGDPYLSGTKIWAADWNDAGRSGCNEHLAEYRNDFLVSMRRLLKGDEDQLQGLIYHSKNKKQGMGTINYISHTNGFTLMDMVSYDRKHNEMNGEENRDGDDYNYSWNCGAEGVTRKKKIVGLRRKQIYNAIVILMLSQGTPMVLAGDEFGNSQKGNNNAYCQDNDISWLNWKDLERNRDIYEFMRFMIAFRKKHPVFSQPQQLRVLDYLSCGYPDVSYHGEKAWYPQFENFRRELGIMYCGLYAKNEAGETDDYFLVIYNMHWESHGFDLPHLPKNRKWYIAVDTSDQVHQGFYENEPVVAARKQLVSPRTIVVLIGK